jgi:hypothetical protein
MTHVTAIGIRPDIPNSSEDTMRDADTHSFSLVSFPEKNKGTVLGLFANLIWR